jgi:hypothetical protein
VTTAILPQGSIQTGITGNWTRVRPSFFRGLARYLEYAEDKCFGLILQSTVGQGRTWQKISWKRFCDVAGVTRRRCEQAIVKLLGEENEAGYIRTRKSPTGGGTEYSIVARPDAEQSSIAKCRGCGTTGEVDLDLDFIPVPHSFFLNLPLSCDHGMYLVVKTVVERTMRWDKATKQIVVTPCEITVEEFERATGKKRSEILQDLAKVQAEGYGFIGAQNIGRGKLYWAKPENFSSAPHRAAREVKQPKERKKRETKKPPNPPQPVDPTKTIRPVEFVTVPCGVCRHCHCYGPVDLVSEAQKSPRKPVATAREAPPPQIRSSFETFKPYKQA